MSTLDYGPATVTRRFVQPTSSLPSPPPRSLETSYQESYFAQSDAPRACDSRYASQPIRGQRPPCTVQKIISQSGTTAGDFESVTKTSFRPPQDASVTRFPKKQEPKPSAIEFPVVIERKKVRGK